MKGKPLELEPLRYYLRQDGDETEVRLVLTQYLDDERTERVRVVARGTAKKRPDEPDNPHVGEYVATIRAMDDLQTRMAEALADYWDALAGERS